MRVLLVSERLDLVGGSERYARAVGRALAAGGDEVLGLAQQPATDAGFPVEVAPELAADRAGRLARVERARLRARVRKARPEVLLVTSCRSPGALAVLLDEAPLLRFVQDHTTFCPGLNKLLADGSPCRDPLGPRCLERYWLGPGCAGLAPRGSRSVRFPARALGRVQTELNLLRRAARVLCASDYVRGELVAAGLDPGHVERLPYFVERPAGEPRRLPEATRSFLSASAAPLVLAPARLVLPDKGLDRLLAALAVLEREVRCVIAGDGPAREGLERMARAAGLAERVHFSGWLGAGALDRLYEEAAIVAFPSVWDEPFGLVGLEAMTHAKPVVAFRVGAVPEWLEDGVTGLLAERGDSDGLARALDALLADPARAAAFGRAGARRAVQRFSRESHVGRLRHLLRATLAPAPGASASAAAAAPLSPRGPVGPSAREIGVRRTQSLENR